MANQTIPCIATVHTYPGEGGPPGFQVLWTVANLRFDARQATTACQIGHRVRLTVDPNPGAKQEFSLIVTDIQDTDSLHVFELEAANVNLVLEGERTPHAWD